MPDPEPSRGGRELLSLRHPRVDEGELRLEPPRFELLTPAQEEAAVELLAALFAAALRRRGRGASRLRRAA